MTDMHRYIFPSKQLNNKDLIIAFWMNWEPYWIMKSGNDSGLQRAV